MFRPNDTGIKTTTINPDNQILFNVQNQMGVSILVDNATAVTEGNRKVVKAGTPLYGNIEERETAFKVAGGEGEAPQGVLIHDVDVTDGQGNGSLLIWGFVNLLRIDETTRAMLTDDVKKAMPMVKFLKQQ